MSTTVHVPNGNRISVTTLLSNPPNLWSDTADSGKLSETYSYGSFTVDRSPSFNEVRDANGDLRRVHRKMRRRKMGEPLLSLKDWKLHVPVQFHCKRNPWKRHNR